jgi:hypothetical protein
MEEIVLVRFRAKIPVLQFPKKGEFLAAQKAVHSIRPELPAATAARLPWPLAASRFSSLRLNSKEFQGLSKHGKTLSY